MVSGIGQYRRQRCARSSRGYSVVDRPDMNEQCLKLTAYFGDGNALSARRGFWPDAGSVRLITSRPA